ncbi:hypothetical protein [Evansella cellulosilytica]|uniref:DUF4083 domain-containing protein n=1 Tax=Evansella cellulosilytica (strain ATCC 21833 / DSM 2522 / FERM P-1141 / JCM 9156 / N-4) TaxID=649639 RepID=E6TYH4_EVAC2|nr:hypothetical protein [Evansella cellulosilytica]ADU28912.1 hypothetical protein Bcell_0630 [Evansella cellulosilytica DSM 2522]
MEFLAFIPIMLFLLVSILPLVLFILIIIWIYSIKSNTEKQVAQNERIIQLLQKIDSKG